MKRFAVLLLALIVCRPALADVAALVSAPAHYAAEWTSNSGKLTLRIDAPVIIPQAEAVYRIDAAPRVFSQEDIRAVGQLFMPGAGAPPAYTQVFSGRYEDWRCRWEADGKVVLAQYATVGQFVTDVRLQAFTKIEREQGEVDAAAPYAQRQAAQHTMTPEQAQALADAAARALDPAMTMTAWGVEQRVPVSAAGSGAYDTQTDFPEYPEYYVFVYTPVIAGVPQLFTFTDCTDEGGWMFPFRCNRLYIAVDTEGVTALTWQAPEAYGERSACTLLPFAQIVDIARHLLPLVQSQVERRYGDGGAAVQIDRITLSYCRLQKRDAPGAYSLTPVWDFFGRSGRMEKGAFHPIVMADAGPYNTLLTLNAIDGTVVDRNYGY